VTGITMLLYRKVCGTKLPS